MTDPLENSSSILKNEASFMLDIVAIRCYCILSPLLLFHFNCRQTEYARVIQP